MFKKLFGRKNPIIGSAAPSVPAQGEAPVEAALASALRLYEAGRLEEAEQAYQEILGLYPGQHVATLQLALIAHRRGNGVRAIELVEEALRLNPLYPPAHNHMGNALRGAQRFEESISSYRRAIALDSAYAAPHFNLGTVLLGKGEIEGALASFEAGLAIDPRNLDAHNALGMALMQAGQPARAVESYRRALQLDPDSFQVLNNLAIALRELKLPSEALRVCRRSLQLNGAIPELHNTLGLLLSDLGQEDDAMAAFRSSIELRPEYPEPHNNLGSVMMKLARYPEAILHFQKALQHAPRYVEALANLGSAFRETREITRALSCCDAALELRPEYRNAHYVRALALVAQGAVPEALAAFELAHCREERDGHSTLLLIMNNSHEATQQGIYLESRRWEELHCAEAAGRRLPHGNGSDPERRLRIGFVSPDFRKHSVSYFVEPLLEQWHREGKGGDCVCYADVAKPDPTTKRLQGLVGQWVDAVGLSDRELAQRVREDGIDILFDLSGHTGQRLGLFAEKPAPVQVSWVGYPNTTGLSAIDYRLTDAVADPEGEPDLYHSERLYRLPDGFLCYGPPEEAPAVAPLPAAENGFVTFGSFNNLAKVTPEVIRLWARLLACVPGSRLVMKCPSFADLPTRRRCEEAFASLGTDPALLDFRAWEQSTESHLSIYGGVDIALDTFPYNGTTTTCEALWMGVPVVTLLGDRHAARVGGSILQRLGLTDLVAGDAERYLAVAASLAGDLERLASLRRSLRGMMARSPLCDAPSFSSALDTACRDMWRRWCLTGGAAADAGAPAFSHKQ